MARPPSTRERLVASAAVAGGALITIGAFLPWLTLFAGLHPLRGVVGLNGRVLAAGGAVCLVVGIRCWRRPAPGLERAVAALGWACTGFAIWLTVQLFITYRELRADPMLVPRLGPGLFLALIGSLLPAATAMLRLMSWRGNRCRHPVRNSGGIMMKRQSSSVRRFRDSGHGPGSRSRCVLRPLDNESGIKGPVRRDQARRRYRRARRTTS